MLSHAVILSLGSNVKEGDSLLHEAKTIAETWFADVTCTSILENPAIDFIISPTMYHNMLMKVNTSLSKEEVKSLTKRMESLLGDTKNLRDMGVVTMDVDMIYYDNILLKPKDIERDYYLKLNRELAI